LSAEFRLFGLVSMVNLRVAGLLPQDAAQIEHGVVYEGDGDAYEPQAEPVSLL
jgi:hypothetical protein